MNKTEVTGIENQSKDKEKTVKRNREDKHRKKDDKSVEHVLKVLSSLETTEEKLGAMCQKYAEMFNDHRILQNAAKVAEKKNSILQKEKEQLQADHSKAILTRSRLENLCRELQRQNKAVKEECMLKIREEEEKKREVAAKFQSTLTELGNLLAQNNDKNAKLRDDNLDMTTKLKNVCEQYEKKEQHVEKMAKQMHLEMQLANTKLAKAKMEMALDKEALLRDNQQLLLELKEYKKQLEEMKLSEVALRSQIQLYNDKYDEFHKALLQSNDAIGSFKQEMERMAKQIRKLEKETVAWKRRYETTHRTLLQMTEEKIKSEESASVSERRLTALQGLCRSLQAQCTQLRGVIKAQAEGSTNVTADDSLMTSTAAGANPEEDISPISPPLDNSNNLNSLEIQEKPVQVSLIDDVTTNTAIKNDTTNKPNESYDSPEEVMVETKLVIDNNTETIDEHIENNIQVSHNSDEVVKKMKELVMENTFAVNAEQSLSDYKENVEDWIPEVIERDELLVDVENEKLNIVKNIISQMINGDVLIDSNDITTCPSSVSIIESDMKSNCMDTIAARVENNLDTIESSSKQLPIKEKIEKENLQNNTSDLESMKKLCTNTTATMVELTEKPSTEIKMTFVVDSNGGVEKLECEQPAVVQQQTATNINHQPGKKNKSKRKKNGNNSVKSSN